MTRIDIASELAIARILGRSRLRAGFLSEERPAAPNASRFTWVVDPLDGTANFASGIPYFAVSIALLEGPHLAAGTIFDPIRGELFSAVPGHGVLVNGRRPARRPRPSLPMILFGLGPKRREAASALRIANTLLTTGATGLRMLGSAALDLASVAAGRADVFFHRRLSSWDIAAGVLLVREAGGTVLLSTMDSIGSSTSNRPALTTNFRGALLAYRPHLPTETAARLRAVIQE